MTENKEPYCFIDDSENIYEHNHPEKKWKPTLRVDLLSLKSIADDDYTLKPEHRLAKLKQELASHGLTITPDTDIDALADVIRTLGIADY